MMLDVWIAIAFIMTCVAIIGLAGWWHALRIDAVEERIRVLDRKVTGALNKQRGYE